MHGFLRPSPEAPHLALGREGEQLAARHLRRHRYKILYQNYRGARGGEIDLVCRDRSCDALVFIEVKTRTNEDRGRPLDAVDRKKQRRIIQGALSWLRLLDRPEVPFRFDVVEVIMSDPPEIRIVPNAFNLPEGYYYN